MPFKYINPGYANLIDDKTADNIQRGLEKSVVDISDWHHRISCGW